MRTLKGAWIISLVAAVLALSAISADADRMYTVRTELQLDPFSITSSLMSIDTTTLAMTLVGPLGVAFIFGDLAWDSATQTLYMIDGLGGAQSLYTINTSTGAATKVGAHNVPFLFALAFDSSTSVMYAGQFFPFAPPPDFNAPLQNLNLATGAATPTGTGLDTNISIGAMAFDSLTNTLFGLNDGLCATACATLYTIDPVTGLATLVPTSGLDTNNSGMTFDPVLNRLWDLDAEGRLSFFDPAAGFAQTEVTTYTLSRFEIFDGLAYVAPEPATWVLLLAGIAALGVRARRRRR